MPDLLNMNLINSLGQLYLLQYGDDDRWWWPLTTIDVQTGLLNYDVCGLINHGRISDVKSFKDEDGNLYDPDDFYLPEKDTPHDTK